MGPVYGPESAAESRENERIARAILVKSCIRYPKNAGGECFRCNLVFFTFSICKARVKRFCVYFSGRRVYPWKATSVPPRNMLGVANGGGWNGGAGASEVVGVDGDSHTVRGRKTSTGWSCQPKRALARAATCPAAGLDPSFQWGINEGRENLWKCTQRLDGATVYGHTTPKRRELVKRPSYFAQKELRLRHAAPPQVRLGQRLRLRFRTLRRAVWPAQRGCSGPGRI